MKILSLLPPTDPKRKPLTFTDDADRAEFFHYFSANPEAAEEVRDLHDAMLRISAAPNRHAGARAVAQKGRDGWSWQYLQRLHAEWESAGRDWRWLLDKRKFPEARKPKLHPLTEDWVRKELLKPQRTLMRGIQAIHAQWRSWWRTGDPKFAIPGMTDADGNPQCPPPDAGYLPRCLQEHNLRRVKIDPVVVEMVRHGTQAGRALLPGIPGTREGARWMEHVSVDDVWLDVRTHVPGCGPCRVLQFGAWEFSASYYDERTFIQRARTPRNDGTWEQLTSRDFLWFIGMFFEKHGWPLDWQMHLLCENGTATLTAAQARMLETITEGQVVVHFNRMEGESMQGWRERMRGNSKAKAGHEGCHSILKNEMSHLIGQSGKDRDHAPALDYGREQEAKRLDDLIVQLPPHEQQRIITGYLRENEVWRETFDALKRIHRNPNHTCEGFERVTEWRPRGFTRAEPAPWHELKAFLAAMPHVTEDNLAEYVEFFDRPETREERKARLSAQGRFLVPPSGAMSIFYEDCMVIDRIGKDGAFEFNKGGKKFRFLGEPGDLKPGEQVCGFYRPDGEVIHLFSGADGKNRRYLLTWASEGKLRRDADAGTRSAFFARKEAHFNHRYELATKATEEQREAVRAAHANNVQVAEENGLLAPNARRGTTPALEAVEAVQAARTEVERAVQETRKVDLVKETLKDAATRKPKADPAAAWL